MLNHYGNPEFNNQSGYVGAFVDYGRVGGVICMLLIGLLAGFLYRQFSQGKPIGVFVYPVVFIGLVESAALHLLGTGTRDLRVDRALGGYRTGVTK